MWRVYARPRVIRGTRTAPLPLLPSGPGGVCSRPLHGARDLTSIYRSMGGERDHLRRGAANTGRSWRGGSMIPLAQYQRATPSGRLHVHRKLVLGGRLFDVVDDDQLRRSFFRLEPEAELGLHGPENIGRRFRSEE